MISVLDLAIAISTAVLPQVVDLSHAREGDFGAKLLITNDPESFWSEWNQKGGIPQIKTTRRITRMSPVETVIVFHDCQAGQDGNCNVSAHYEITDPDGKPYDKPVETMAWNGPPAPAHNLIAATNSMGFVLEPTDRLGLYVISAILTDRVAGKSLSLSESVMAEDSEEAPPRTD